MAVGAPLSPERVARSTLVVALVLAFAADEAALEAGEATSLVASLVWEQLVTSDAAMARPTAAAVVRVSLVVIAGGYPRLDVHRSRLGNRPQTVRTFINEQTRLR